ncbi:MAG: DNA polymerase IV, partial [Planctomycetaceae bacterium]
SLDEAFLDVTGSEQLFGQATQIARSIKDQIHSSLDLIASVGVAPNKFLAKVASDHDKPDGFCVVTPDRVAEFLGPLDVNRLWGVGHVTGGRLRQLGAQTVADARRFSQNVLEQHFGQQGTQIWELVRGIARRPVVPDRSAKSISRETTFPQDVSDPDILRTILLELTEHLSWRLRQQRLTGSTVFVKVRLSDFRTRIRTRTLTTATSRTHDLWQAAALLLDDCLAGLQQSLRLVGIGIGGLKQACQRQAALFPHEADESAERLDSAADQIRARFGPQAIQHGSVLNRRIQHTSPPDSDAVWRPSQPGDKLRPQPPDTNRDSVE